MFESSCVCVLVVVECSDAGCRKEEGRQGRVGI